jgi:5-formyltetrahydrofolate cyclo-ligase
MTISAQKLEIRRQMKRMRRALTATEQLEAGRSVEDKVLTLELLTTPQRIFCYLAARNELPTEQLILTLIDKGHTVAIPFSLPDGQMFPRILRNLDDLIEGHYNIPTSKGPELEGSPTLALIPALAFDRQGNRVGYGGGYYDRFLKKHPTMTRIGIGYDFQLMNMVPTEPTDMSLHVLITPKQKLSF